MRRSLTIFTAGILLWFAVGPGVKCVAAQAQQTVAELFGELQSGVTSGQARSQLVQLGNSDPGVKRFLARHLPAVIEVDPRDSRPEYRTVMRTEWYNAVELAAELRIAQTAPALTKWITYRAVPGMASMSLEDCHAAKALVQIGDPAVPSLRNALFHGNRDQPSQAMSVLFAIGSPKAKSVLRQYGADGKDRDLAEFIKKNAALK